MHTNETLSRIVAVSVIVFAAGLLSAGPTPKAKEAEPLENAKVATKPEHAATAIIRAFDTHQIVMLGEIHANREEYEWLRTLVSTPEFADRVDDIVLEFGNSLYQKSVDRYVAGEDIALDQVQKAWRNLIGAIGPVSPVYPSLYQAVREANLKRRGKHQMRIVLGDPYGDWEKIKDREDLGPYLANRDQWYAQVVKDEVLGKHHRAFLIMGSMHFLRRHGPGRIEQELRSAGASTYLVVFGTNVVGGYDELDKRFESWPVPSIVSLNGNWVGELPALAITSGGNAPVTSNSLRLADAADALLYLGPRDSLTQVSMPRSELDGTPYGKEIARRLMIQIGRPINFISDQAEAPQFQRRQPQAAKVSAPPSLPPPPKSMSDPLPPRPPSQ